MEVKAKRGTPFVNASSPFSDADWRRKRDIGAAGGLLCAVGAGGGAEDTFETAAVVALSDI
jgi:hypothetical protein